MPSSAVYFVSPRSIAALAASFTLSGVSKSGSPAPRIMTGKPAFFIAPARAPICRIFETPMAAMREAGVKPASSILGTTLIATYSMSKETPCASGRAFE